jgi:hypothetical protein
MSDKFKKAKPTAVPHIPLDQRLVDPSSLGKDESLESAPSPARTVNPDDPNEDAEMQGEGNQNAASASKSSDSDSSSSMANMHRIMADQTATSSAEIAKAMQAAAT